MSVEGSCESSSSISLSSRMDIVDERSNFSSVSNFSDDDSVEERGGGRGRRRRSSSRRVVDEEEEEEEGRWGWWRKKKGGGGGGSDGEEGDEEDGEEGLTFDEEARFGISETGSCGSSDEREAMEQANQLRTQVATWEEMEAQRANLVREVKVLQEAEEAAKEEHDKMGVAEKLTVGLQRTLRATPVTERARRAFLLLILFTYTPTMNMILTMLRCRAPFPEETKRTILVFDHTVQCTDENGDWNSEYFKYRIVCIVLAAVYVYALPVALLVALLGHRFRPEWVPNWMNGALEMLLFPFESVFFMYGPWLELRKTLVVTILQLSGEDSNLTRLLILVLFTVFAICHLMLRPYEDSALDIMETVTLLVLLAASLLAASTWTSDTSSTTQLQINDMLTTLEYLPYAILGICIMYIVWSRVCVVVGREVTGRKLTELGRLEVERRGRVERARVVVLGVPGWGEEGGGFAGECVKLVEEAWPAGAQAGGGEADGGAGAKAGSAEGGGGGKGGKGGDGGKGGSAEGGDGGKGGADAEGGKATGLGKE